MMRDEFSSGEEIDELDADAQRVSLTQFMQPVSSDDDCCYLSEPPLQSDTAKSASTSTGG